VNSSSNSSGNSSAPAHVVRKGVRLNNRAAARAGGPYSIITSPLNKLKRSNRNNHSNLNSSSSSSSSSSSNTGPGENEADSMTFAHSRLAKDDPPAPLNTDARVYSRHLFTSSSPSSRLFSPHTKRPPATVRLLSPRISSSSSSSSRAGSVTCRVSMVSQFNETTARIDNQETFDHFPLPMLGKAFRAGGFRVGGNGKQQLVPADTAEGSASPAVSNSKPGTSQSARTSSKPGTSQSARNGNGGVASRNASSKNSKHSNKQSRVNSRGGTSQGGAGDGVFGSQKTGNSSSNVYPATNPSMQKVNSLGQWSVQPTPRATPELRRMSIFSPPG